ncbi:Mus7/MMS22 family-domain-containing protein [Sparassis latifolia]
MEIRGDSESSDIEILDVDASASASSSDTSSESDMDVVSCPMHTRKHVSDPSGITVSDAESQHDDDSVNAEVGEWLAEGPTAGRSMSSRSGEAKEGDLIDRMLSRTRVDGAKPKRNRNKHRPSGNHRSHKSSSKSKVHVVTAGARNSGSGRQTFLPFTPNNSVNETADDSRRSKSNEHHVQTDEASYRMNGKHRKRQKHKKGDGLFVVTSGGEHLVSGRLHKQPTTIDEEQVAVHDSRLTLLHDRSNEDLPRPVRPHRPRPKSARQVETTLEHYWDERRNSVDSTSESMHKAAQDQDTALYGEMTADCKVSFLPSGLSMGATTYMARGWLHELISLLSATGEIPSPIAYSMFDLRLQSQMSTQDISVCLESTYEMLHDHVTQRRGDSLDDSQLWQTFLHSLCEHFSWLLSNAGEDDTVSLYVSATKQLHRFAIFMEEPTEILPDDEKPNLLSMEIRWFMVELSCRVECHRLRQHKQAEDSNIMTHVKQLIRLLWRYGFEKMGSFLNEDPPGKIEPSKPQRAAELWISLIHLLDTWPSCMSGANIQSANSSAFWTMYAQTIESYGLLQSFSSDLRASETMWKSIFSLCALSQFSVHGLTTSSPRLSASWAIVLLPLAKIPLTPLPTDAKLPTRLLNKRDECIRLNVSRCLVLSHKWRWDLGDAFPVFNCLLEIFKSRRFANLSFEPSDFPSWLRHDNLQLLSETKRSDTAFTLFLKLLVQSVKDAQKDHDGNRKVKKLLAIYIPVGSVPFTKANPPTGQELSMLYNRFSAVAVAIFLEPTSANVKSRLAHARRYVDFKDTDHETRRACIRGLMHLTILLRHLHLALDDILDWLSEITNVLVDEYCEAEVAGTKTFGRDPRKWIVICIQMLLGCVRRIIETPLMDPDQTSAQYPDPALLQGPWIARVFSNQTNLTSVITTGLEIRRLVQAFLDARARVIPRPPRPRPVSAVAEETQESQEDYGMFDLNMDDPELLAALGEVEESARMQDQKAKETVVAEIIDMHISPAIYRLVCKHFQQGSTEGYSLQDTDRWIDCWVGCVSVVVQNGKRDWDMYLQMGSQSWQRIIDSMWRRRVGLRFMFMLLQLDPSAYPTYTDRFIDIFMESIVTARVSFEHDFTSLLFSIDGLRYPLFRDLPCELPEDSTDYKLSKKNFLDGRIAIVEKICANLADCLQEELAGNSKLIGQNQTSIGSLMTMLSTMQDIYNQFEAGSEDRVKYESFCKQVADCLSRHALLRTNSRLAALFDWTTHLS